MILLFCQTLAFYNLSYFDKNSGRFWHPQTWEQQVLQNLVSLIFVVFSLRPYIPKGLFCNIPLNIFDYKTNVMAYANDKKQQKFQKIICISLNSFKHSNDFFPGLTCFRIIYLVWFTVHHWQLEGDLKTTPLMKSTFLFFNQPSHSLHSSKRSFLNTV